MVMIGDHGDDLESVTIRTESCHPQDIGCHGDYIDYVKQTEEVLHDPSLPVVKVQPIRIEGFGSNDLNVQKCSKDDKVIMSYDVTVYDMMIVVIAILPYCSIDEITIITVCYHGDNDHCC